MKDLRDVNVKLKKPQPHDQQLTVTVVVTWSLLLVVGLIMFFWLG